MFSDDTGKNKFSNAAPTIVPWLMNEWYFWCSVKKVEDDTYCSKLFVRTKIFALISLESSQTYIATAAYFCLRMFFLLLNQPKSLFIKRTRERVNVVPDYKTIHLGIYASEHKSKVISMTKKCRKICFYKTSIESDDEDDKRRYKKCYTIF
jgi:hypothetical protein